MTPTNTTLPPTVHFTNLHHYLSSLLPPTINVTFNLNDATQSSRTTLHNISDSNIALLLLGYTLTKHFPDHEQKMNTTWTFTRTTPDTP